VFVWAVRLVTLPIAAIGDEPGDGGGDGGSGGVGMVTAVGMAAAEAWGW
jgi:hypothetical protein